MTFWNKFKFKKKPFKEGAPEKAEKKDITPKKEEKPKKEEIVEKKIEKPKEVKSPIAKATEGKPKKVKKEDTGDAHRILIRPIISEKVTGLGMLNQYVFEVSLRASKNEIKKAIRNVYGVTPTRVHVISVLGKRVRFGRNFGKLKDRKKAIITLKQGETIQIYEGV